MRIPPTTQRRWIWRSIVAALALIVAGASHAQEPAALLPSWNDGPAKKSIIEFVTRVTSEGSPDFVLPAERIAVFDNDGTLWCEQPLYFQVAFAFDRIKALHRNTRNGKPYSHSEV